MARVKCLGDDEIKYVGSSGDRQKKFTEAAKKRAGKDRYKVYKLGQKVYAIRKSFSSKLAKLKIENKRLRDANAQGQLFVDKKPVKKSELKKTEPQNVKQEVRKRIVYKERVVLKYKRYLVKDFNALVESRVNERLVRITKHRQDYFSNPLTTNLYYFILSKYLESYNLNIKGWNFLNVVSCFEWCTFQDLSNWGFEKTVVPMLKTKMAKNDFVTSYGISHKTHIKITHKGINLIKKFSEVFKEEMNELYYKPLALIENGKAE